MVYLKAVLKQDGKHVRLHAPGFALPDDAVAAFVDRHGVYARDFLRLDQHGRPEYVSRDEIARVTAENGPSHIDG
jgi:hypothetical protein